MKRAALTCFLMAAVLACGGARATPLDAESCTKLKGEQAELEQAGVRGTMSKGPEWAKANLAADKLDQIKRLIEVDEQLLFRCSAKSLVTLPSDADGETAAGPAEGKAADKAAPTPKQETGKSAATAPPKKALKAAPADKEKAAPAPKKAPAAPAAKGPPAAAKGPAPAKDDKAAQAKAAKAKKKVDDAYRPPPVDPGTNPFAGQAAPDPKPKTP